MQQDLVVLKEIKLLQQISKDCHPNIIMFHDYCILIQKFNEYTTTTLAYILMELAEFGSLGKFMEERNATEISSFIDQAFEAFSYLQSINVAHCDIKPENILISSLKPLKIKICDIGSGKHLSSVNNQTSLLTGVKNILTIAFMSPEMLRHIQNPIEHNNKFNLFVSDVFSFGLVLLYFCTFQKFRTFERSQYVTDDEGLQKQIQLYIDSVQNEQIWGENSCIKQLLILTLEIDNSKRQDFITLKQQWEEIKVRTIRSNSFNSMFFETSQQNIQLEFDAGKQQTKSIPIGTPVIRQKNRKQISLQEKIALSALIPSNQEISFQNDSQEQHQRNNSFRINEKFSPVKQIRNSMNKTNQFHISPGQKKYRTKQSFPNDSLIETSQQQNNQIQLFKISVKKISNFNGSLNCTTAANLQPTSNKITLSPIKLTNKINSNFNQNVIDFSDQQFRQTALPNIHAGEFIQIKNISFMQQSNPRHSPTRKMKLSRIQND